MNRTEAQKELIEIFDDYPVSHKDMKRFIDRIFDDIDGKEENDIQKTKITIKKIDEIFSNIGRR